MNDPIKNGYINWVDGMKISKDHFIAMQRATEDRIRDVRSIVQSQNDFGFISGKVNGKESLVYNLLIEHPGRVIVELYQCRAISPAGDRVEVVSALNAQTVAIRKEFEVELDSKIEHVDYDVIIKINSFEMSPYGEPDVNESPARHPFAQPHYDLELVPSKEIKYNEYNRNFVIIARVEARHGELQEIKEFIPPCMSWESLPELEDFFFKYVKFLKDLEQNLFKILIKLNGTAQKTQLAANVETISKGMLGVIESDSDMLTMRYRGSSPVLMISHVARFARNMKHSLELMTGLGKDELLNYVREVIDLSPGEFMNVLNDLTSLEYDHYDILESLKRILVFCKTNGRLFDEWSRLDYIGKKKSTDIYVAEKQVEDPVPAPKPKRKWDF